MDRRVLEHLLTLTTFIRYHKSSHGPIITKSQASVCSKDRNTLPPQRQQRAGHTYILYHTHLVIPGRGMYVGIILYSTPFSVPPPL